MLGVILHFWLAYTPFLDPLDLDEYWLWLLLPLVFLIAVVYKAIKLNDMVKVPKQAVLLTVQIVAVMILAAASLWLLSEII